VLTTDRVAGAALVLAALLALADSRGLPLGTVRNPGPAYVPVLLAGALLLLGVLIGARGGRAPRLGAVGWSEWRHALAILAVCAFAAWGLERLGYRLTVTASLLETPIAFKQGEEFRRFFDADARRLAEGVRKVGKVEPK